MKDTSLYPKLVVSEHTSYEKTNDKGYVTNSTTQCGHSLLPLIQKLRP